MTDSRWFDPEIDGILDGDAELTSLAHSVRAARPEPPLDPRFQSVLRAQLMREAPAALGAAAAKPVRPRTIRVRRGWWQRPTGFAWGGAGLGVALVAAAVLTVFRTPVVDHQVTAMSPVAELHAVSPNNVITVSFSQPMNEAAVVAGLHIRPATEITTRWQGNNLLITPTYHLTGNTPYTVTIDHNATRAVNGQMAASDIRIDFGTAPTPPPGPVIAQLAPQTLSSVNDSAQLISAGDGAVIATSSNATIGAPGGSHAPPQSTASPAASASPGASASASASVSPAASPAASSEVVLMSAHGVVVDLGPAASSAALAPNGLRIVAAVPSATGTTIEIVSLDGSDRHALATLAAPVLATGWLSNGTALAAEPDRIVTVDLAGHVGALTILPANTSSVVFAPAGGQAYAGATSQDGALIDLASLNTRILPGSRQTAAFSGDGSVVAWVDATGAAPRLLTSPVSRDTTVAVPLTHPGDSVRAIALDEAGTHVAVVTAPQVGTGALDVLALPSGAVTASGRDARVPVYSTQGDQLAFVSGGNAEVAAVPGVAAGTTVNLLPDGAAQTLKAFVDAQVAGNSAALQNLSSAGVGAAAATPPGLSRAYVISAAANPDGSVAATVRLIVDPSATHAAASIADETLLLSLAPTPAGGYVVSALTAGTLHDEPVGPHVVSVVPVTGSTLVLQVSFDSDLRAASVAPAITVTNAQGRQLATTIAYDAGARTATLTLDVPADTPVTLSIATSLVDVDGQALASAFSTAAGG
jgi:trimeric autotransporter adhesin